MKKYTNYLLKTHLVDTLFQGSHAQIIVIDIWSKMQAHISFYNKLKCLKIYPNQKTEYRQYRWSQEEVNVKLFSEGKPTVNKLIF